MIWRWEVINRWLKNDCIIPRLGVEIGVKEGRFTLYMLENNPKLEMICIDPWMAQDEGNETYTEWNFNDIYNQYTRAIEPYQDRVTEFRCMSDEAVKFIKPLSLDFCFIDAQHDYDSVLNDIVKWISKIKPGGLLCGHDYNPVKFPGCVDAVDQAFNKKAMKGGNDVWGIWL